MTKEEILAEIERTTQQNSGKPLGMARFQRETGIKPYDILKFWSKYGDAIKEAGFKPNKLQFSHSEDFVLENLATLTKKLGKFPVRGDLIVKRNSDRKFPSPNSISRIGKKMELAKKLLEYSNNKGYEDVSKICEDMLEEYKDKGSQTQLREKINVGSVYLFKSGKYYKIGKSNDTVRRGHELRIQLPERIDLIHHITTDDPSGIEAYWHRRFAEKRMNGEWFDLNSNDIKSFKRWRKIT